MVLGKLVITPSHSHCVVGVESETSGQRFSRRLFPTPPVLHILTVSCCPSRLLPKKRAHIETWIHTAFSTIVRSKFPALDNRMLMKVYNSCGEENERGDFTLFSVRTLNDITLLKVSSSSNAWLHNSCLPSGGFHTKNVHPARAAHPAPIRRVLGVDCFFGAVDVTLTRFLYHTAKFRSALVLLIMTPVHRFVSMM